VSKGSVSAAIRRQSLIDCGDVGAQWSNCRACSNLGRTGHFLRCQPGSASFGRSRLHCTNFGTVSFQAQHCSHFISLYFPSCLRPSGPILRFLNLKICHFGRCLLPMGGILALSLHFPVRPAQYENAAKFIHLLWFVLGCAWSVSVVLVRTALFVHPRENHRC